MCCDSHWKRLNGNTLTETRLRQREERARFEEWCARVRAVQADRARAWETVKAGEFAPARATTMTITVTGTVTATTTPEKVPVTA
jgi:hypothetical protein